MSTLTLQGGGIFINGGNLAIASSLIDSNRASARGGAISASGGRVLLSNATLFTNNTAQSDGATLYIELATVVYTLPVPAGRYIAASVCEVVYTACPSSWPCRGNCGSDRSLTPAASTSGCGARAPFNIQSCPWDVRLNSNAFDPDFIIGLNFQSLPPGALNSPEWPLPCLPGIRGASADYQEVQKTSLCAGFCDAGFYCPTEATVEPLICGAGEVCPTGSALPQFCTPGTYSNKTGLSSQHDCTECPPGSSCSTGSVLPTPCAPGSIAPSGGSAECVACEGGSYRAEANGTACATCTTGSYCLPGASAPLPCPVGTHQDLALTTPMTSESQCIECRAGSFCPTGAAVPTNCSAGTFSSVGRQSACLKCSKGEFQDAEGTTACKACDAGHYCPLGASTPLACPGQLPSIPRSLSQCSPQNLLQHRVGGTYNNATRATAREACIKVEPGFWAPTGSTAPIHCPTSGFR